MRVYRILSSTLQDFEKRFLNTPMFVPNFLRFREKPNICKGVYDEGSLVGTFVLQPYAEVRGYKRSKVLRIERPLVDVTLSNKKRSEIFKVMKEDVVDFANSQSCSFIEMELYDRIDREIFFPSSPSTVGTFNLPQDYRYLKDNSFEEIKVTMCFEIVKSSESYRADVGESTPLSGHTLFKPDQWSIADPESMGHIYTLYSDQISLFSGMSLTPLAFNLPEYLLVRKGPKPAIIKWYPDFFLLSKDNWRPLIVPKEEIRKRVLSIDRGKIYRFLGFRMEDLLFHIDKIWTTGPLSRISKLQIFSDIRYYDVVDIFGGNVVHTLRRIRKSL